MPVTLASCLGLTSDAPGACPHDYQHRMPQVPVPMTTTESIPFHDSFMVINQPVAEGYVFSKNVSQPIEGIIGSPFMAKQGWTLDFAQKVIYKRNCQTD